jgi:hypothetical protein
MAKNIFDLRFAIKNDSGMKSHIWRLWVTSHGDVYLATRTMAKIEKFSFHKSGICRSAFTTEYGTPKSLPDRAMYKWNRLQTPPAGEGRAVRVAWLGFPTDFLSRIPELDAKNIVWIDAAPAGCATYVELSYTHDSEAFVRMTFQESQDRKLLAYVILPTNESFFICYYHSDWENKEIKIPGNGEVADLIFSHHDPLNTGRPIRIRFGSAPKDGDALVLQELGGYAMT